LFASHFLRLLLHVFLQQQQAGPHAASEVAAAKTWPAFMNDKRMRLSSSEPCFTNDSLYPMDESSMKVTLLPINPCTASLLSSPNPTEELSTPDIIGLRNHLHG
jgi:hypothetical protein